MMKLFPAPSVLLVLLTQLCASTHTHSAHVSLCWRFPSMVHLVEQLWKDAKHIHHLKGKQLQDFAAGEQTVRNLPQITHTVAHLTTMKVNQSLSQMFTYIQSLSEHMHWLKSAQDRVSVASHSSEVVTRHLIKLSLLLNATLQQIGEMPPPSPTSPPSPSPPPSPTSPPSAFNVLRYSVKTSQRITAFCDWSKRLLYLIKLQLHCV